MQLQPRLRPQGAFATRCSSCPVHEKITPSSSIHAEAFQSPTSRIQWLRVDGAVSADLMVHVPCCPQLQVEVARLSKTCLG
jgi:hypothetical protein